MYVDISGVVTRRTESEGGLSLVLGCVLPCCFLVLESVLFIFLRMHVFRIKQVRHKRRGQGLKRAQDTVRDKETRPTDRQDRQDKYPILAHTLSLCVYVCVFVPLFFFLVFCCERAHERKKCILFFPFFFFLFSFLFAKPHQPYLASLLCWPRSLVCPPRTITSFSYNHLDLLVGNDSITNKDYLCAKVQS